MTREEAKQHIEKIRLYKFGIAMDGTKQPNALERDLQAALKNLAEELNAKETHFILELLQNAEDNTYGDGVEPELCISVEANDPTETPESDGCLCLLNNEVGFQHEQVLSLCSVGQSTKKKALGYIGEKGIGFKSVFRISERPHIFSNGYQFRFQKPQDLDDLGYIVPHWVDFAPGIVRSGFTAILLPLVTGKRGSITEKLLDIPPETILFLTKLRRLTIGNTHSVARDKSTGLVTLSSDAQASLYFVHREMQQRRPGLCEEKRVGVIEREVTIALPLKTGRRCTGRIFAFLPTELDTGLPFLVNADFVLSASRESVLVDRPWNQWLRDCIAPTFAKTFLSLVKDPTWRTDAYRFLPIASELGHGAEFFAPAVESVQRQLREEACILTTSDSYVCPPVAFFASEDARRLIFQPDPPPRLSEFAFVHSALEAHRGRLEPLRVRSLSVPQLLQICNERDWLHRRDAAWWEGLFEYLEARNVAAETVADFPLLPCADGVSRCPSDNSVFFKADGQTMPTALPSEWPAAHLFDDDLQSRLQKKPQVWVWMTCVAGLRPFSAQSYITGRLLEWMRGQTGEHAADRLIKATCFIAVNLKSLDDHHQTLRERMPWLLADKRVLLPEARVGKELVTPECIEGDSGWNWVFIGEHDRQHFWVLSDAYVEGQTEATKDAVRKVMTACGATDVPDPVKLRLLNGQVDWGCPRWLRDLTLDQPPQSLERKIAALERWMGRFKPDTFNGVSELGLALRIRPWLQSTMGLVSPAAAFVDDADIREFFGNSVPYVQTKLSPDLLGRLGVHLRLSASSLLDLLRQMQDRGGVDEALVVRIYRRLQTMEFSVDAFREAPLIFLSRPSSRWMSTKNVFWRDVGAVFDRHFGYASLTYEKEELHGFFTKKLGIDEQPQAEQYADVWLRMSTAPQDEQKTIEGRLKEILPKLAEAADIEKPPDWWLQQRGSIKVWTTAGQFVNPQTAFTPDNTFAEELFAQSAKIAWAPETHLTARLNRLLHSLGCRSLATHLKSRPATAAGTTLVTKPGFLTPASKEILVCWAGESGDWSKKKHGLEMLLGTDETDVTELVVEYWLDGTDVPKTSREADAFWDRNDRRLYLRHSATAKAQQSAVAASITAQLGRTGKQAADTVYRLLALEFADARREMAERKWTLTPAQRDWLRSLGIEFTLLKVAPDDGSQVPREARPATALAIPPSHPSPTPATSQTVGSQQPPSNTDRQETKDPRADQLVGTARPTDSQPKISPDSKAAAETEASRTQDNQRQGEKREASDNGSSLSDKDDKGVSQPLKPVDTEVDFVHVTAHTRSRPRLERNRSELTGSRTQDKNPLTRVSSKSKAELEERAMEIIKHQFQKRSDLREFKLLDRRKECCGYDLHAAKPGRVLRIEIKAHAGEAKSVFVTTREWDESRKRNRLAADDRWELWNVENVAGETSMARITRYPHLPEEARSREVGYWVDLNACHSESVQ